MKNLQPLYQNLGHLFYSIAAADKNINPKEIQELNQAVQKSWLAYDDSTDEYGTDAANYINIAFEYLTETAPTADDAYQQFEAFYIDNRELFTKELKNQIIDTASNIGHAFAGINKAELNKMAALTLLFNK